MNMYTDNLGTASWIGASASSFGVFMCNSGSASTLIQVGEVATNQWMYLQDGYSTTHIHCMLDS